MILILHSYELTGSVAVRQRIFCQTVTCSGSCEMVLPLLGERVGVRASVFTGRLRDKGWAQ